MHSSNDYSLYNNGLNNYGNRDLTRHAQASTYFAANKPFIWGELGHPDGTAEIDRYSDRTFHNANWISVMSGALGTGMYWNDFDQAGGVNCKEKDLFWKLSNNDQTFNNSNGDYSVIILNDTIFKIYQYAIYNYTKKLVFVYEYKPFVYK